MENEEQTRTRLPINLEMLGIRPGDLLVLVGGSGDTCTVVEAYPPRVVHDSAVKTLTDACNDAYGVEYNDPAAAWTYEGETLWQRRSRFETYHCR